MKRFLVLISPTIFLVFVFCGGDDEPPLPPIKDLPKVTAEIKCADSSLSRALAKCKGAINKALPQILAAPDQGSALMIALQTANKAEDEYAQTAQTNNNRVTSGIDRANKAAKDAISGDLQYVNGLVSSYPKGAGAAMGALQARTAQVQTLAPDISIDPDCGGGKADPSTTCKDDLTTSLLLWKSAHKTDDTLAINDPQYQQYLFSEIRGVMQSAAKDLQSSNGLTDTQVSQLGQTLQTAFLKQSGTLGIDSMTRAKVQGLLPKQTTQTTQASTATTPNGNKPFANVKTELTTPGNHVVTRAAESTEVVSLADLKKAKKAMTSSSLTVTPSTATSTSSQK